MNLQTTVSSAANLGAILSPPRRVNSAKNLRFVRTRQSWKCSASLSMAPPVAKLTQGWLLVLVTALPLCVGASQARAQTAAPASQEQLEPLAAKEQMIRDRFQRFADRIYALSDELSEVEPDNAARLARALERAGELGLSDQLEQIVKLLNEPATLHQAVDAQSEWLANAERVLGILLERDGGNEERRSEIERLEAYRKRIGEILEQQRALRDTTANATSTARMKEQLEQALKRLEAIMKAQAQVEEQGKNASSEDERKDAAAEQERLSRQTDELAEELKRLSQPAAEVNEPPSLQEAREHTKGASESSKSAAQSQSQAGQNMQQGSSPQSQQQQQEAQQSLEKAKEQLEAAQKALGEKQSNAEQSQEQQQLAEKTQQLGDQMQQDSASSGSKGKSGGKQGQQSAQKNVQQAEKEMEDAAESLDQEKPDEAAPKQDKAIDELEEAKRELEEQLQQLRKEEREETLRDLEARFRDMLARQRPINDATVELDQTGVENFSRADELRLADLVAQEAKLAEDAASCLHILDEEGTTIAFPHVVGQIAEDMRTVADRLAQSKVEVVTQTIEREIVEALEQLLEAVQKMQQENEQNSQQASSQDSEPPLLPKSAELKLLRASQERVNTRTETIESSAAAGEESPQSAASSLKKLAQRQVECMGIAKQMRDRKQ